MKGYALYVISLAMLLSGVEVYSQKEIMITESKIKENPKSTPYIDSIKQLIKTSKSEKIAVLQFELFREYLTINIDSSQVYVDRSLNSARKVGDSLSMVNALNGTGGILSSKGDCKEAIEYFKKALRIAKRNGYSKQVKFLLNNLAVNFSQISEFDQALYYNFESLKIREIESLPVDISIALNNIGWIYQEMGNFDEALKYYERCYKMKMENNIAYALVRVITNIGTVLNDQGKFLEAESSLKNALRVCDSLQCDPMDRIVVFTALGESQFKLCKHDSASFSLITSIDLASRYPISKQGTSFMGAKCQSYYWLAKIEMEKGYYTRALEYLELSQQIAKKAGFQRRMVKDYELYSQIFYRIGDYKRSVDSLYLFQKVNAEIMNADVIRRVAKAQSDLDGRVREAKIKDQEEILGLQEQTIRQQKIMNLLTGAVAILILGIAIFLIRMIIQKQKINNLLDLRVRERTHDLERSRDEFRHANEEKLFVLKKVSGDLAAALASLNGISSLAAKDQLDEQSTYFEQVAVITRKMMSYINQYLPGNGSGS